MMQTRMSLWATGLFLVVSTAVMDVEAATSKVSKTKAKLCQRDVDHLCQNLGNIPVLDCLWIPENREQLSPICKKELQTRINKTYEICRPVAELVCKKEVQEGSIIIHCLRKRMKDPGFPEECKARLNQIKQLPPLWEQTPVQ